MVPRTLGGTLIVTPFWAEGFSGRALAKQYVFERIRLVTGPAASGFGKDSCQETYFLKARDRADWLAVWRVENGAENLFIGLDEMLDVHHGGDIVGAQAGEDGQAQPEGREEDLTVVKI